MTQPLTREQAQKAFEAVAARGDEIAFRWLREGCECRAQLMIEFLQARGLEPGRAWAVAVGRPLTFPHPTNTASSYKWWNHVAPIVAAGGVEHGVLVIDPSLSSSGPATLKEWAAQLRAKAIEVSETGLSQAEIMARQTARALRGEDLDAIVFKLKLGEPPIPETGGTGFCIGVDPPQGAAVFAREQMLTFLANQRRLKSG